jgi:hypothetical protein
VVCRPENKTARAVKHGPPVVLFGIDQEVVTLRGLYGNSGSQRDLTPGGKSKLTGSVRAVAL